MRDYFKKNKEQILNDYFKLLRFPSISANADCAPHMLACVNYLKEKLDALGFETQLWPTSTYPTLFASWTKAGPNQSTVLIYNHYDVQPVDPLEKWTYPPFEPTLVGDEVFARGAQDNKGQCFYVIEALKALLQQDGTLPVNVKLCIEGDEEVGSEGLAGICNFKQQELNADYLLIADMGIKSASQPAITLGTRGLVTMELSLRSSSGDLHSGEHGGIVINPIHALVELLAKLHDSESGRVMIPGFYDDVKTISTENLDIAFDAKAYEKMFGALPIGGEKNYSPLESAWLRPTLEINGIWGGYTAPGFKTVIPAVASAKISCRLVSDQDPLKIRALVAEFLQAEKPEGVLLHLEMLHGKSRAVRTDANSHIARTVAQAYTEVFGTPCKMIQAGGSIGIINDLVSASHTEPVFLGLGLPDDAIHAPNEHFSLTRLSQGIQIIAKTLQLLKII